MPTLIAPLLWTVLLQPGVEGPEPAPRVATNPARLEAESAAAWGAERRRLQIHTGLSGGFAGAMFLTGMLLMFAPDGCDSVNCELPLGRFFTGVGLVALSSIPTATGIYWGVRLHRHNKARPVAVLRPGAGGLALQF